MGGKGRQTEAAWFAQEARRLKRALGSLPGVKCVTVRRGCCSDIGCPVCYLPEVTIRMEDGGKEHIYFDGATYRTTCGRELAKQIATVLRAA